MRKNPTPAEKALRKAFADEGLGSCTSARRSGPDRLRFQFQSICAGYVLDFFCASRRIAVEVDGSSHDGRERHDETRDALLRDRFKILTLRFTNEDVLSNPAGVVEKIMRFCMSRERFGSWNAGLTRKRK